MDIRAFLLAPFLLAVMSCGGEQSAPAVSSFHMLQGSAIGTTWVVKWKGPPGEETSIKSLIEGELNRLDQRMSTWRKDSELNGIQNANSLAPISSETALVIKAALDLAENTEGAFDPTVEPLMALWGFYGTPRRTLPSEEAITKAQNRIGYNRVILRSTQDQWEINPQGTALDLSAIAKGTGVDWIANTLTQRQRTDFMVEVGGEMRMSGDGPQGKGWRVAVDDPSVQPNERGIGFVLNLQNMSVATSGNYRNQYIIEGKTVGHTVDPRTGHPAQSHVRSATVITKDCQTADGAATALMVMDYEEGKLWADTHPELEAAWILLENDQWIIKHTEGFAPYLAEVAEGFSLE